MFSLSLDFKDYTRTKRSKFCSNLKMCLLNTLPSVENQSRRQFRTEASLSNSEKAWNAIFLFSVKRQGNLKNTHCDLMCLALSCTFSLKVCLLMMFLKELVGLPTKAFLFKNFTSLGELSQTSFFGTLTITYFRSWPYCYLTSLLLCGCPMSISLMVWASLPVSFAFV